MVEPAQPPLKEWTQTVTIRFGVSFFFSFFLSQCVTVVGPTWADPFTTGPTISFFPKKMKKMLQQLVAADGSEPLSTLLIRLIKSTGTFNCNN